MPLDLIRRVNDQAVLSVAHLQALTRQIAGATNVPVSAMVEVERQGQSLLSAIRLGVPHPEPPGAKSRKAWMGMHVQAVSREMAALLQTNTLTGVRITQVFPESQAAAAGLRVGDVIVGLDDERVTVSMVGEESYFFSRIRQYTVGKEVRLGILRAGQATNLLVTLDETPATAQEKEKFLDAKFEFVARDLTLDDRIRQKLPRDLEAVIVVDVTDGGWAALGGLAPGDLILTVAQHPITAVSVLSATMGDISAAKPAQVVMHIRRGIHTMFVELEPEWAEGKTVVASQEKKKEGKTR
jgi:S1-C subfamily serine protease